MSSPKSQKDVSPVTKSLIPVEQSLEHRYQTVTQLTKGYYKSDVVPPTTKSQALRAQKFAVYYYYGMNLIFFLYGFFIPKNVPGPYYGGLSLTDWQATGGHLTLLAVVMFLVFIRCFVMSWSAQFYHFLFVLVGLEATMVITTYFWWSPGVPVISVLFASNLLNISISQLYWARKLTAVVRDLPSLVPPVSPLVEDTTTLEVWNGTWHEWFEDLKGLWGWKKKRTQAVLYDERCGVFGNREQMSHVDAMYGAYMQAVDPNRCWVQWEHDDPHMSSLHISAMFDGLLRTFISNVAFAFAGLWLGKVGFVELKRIEWAITCSVAILLTASWSLWRTTMWMDEALGVAVAEKEWLAFDVVRHSGEREELTHEALDSTHYGDPGFDGGRSNLVFMWLCAASTADFIGESYMSRLFGNLAVQSKFMLEALTHKEFKLYAHARWEVSWQGHMLKALQNFMLCMISALYFGGEFMPPLTVPTPLMAGIAGACFVHSLMSLSEALYFAYAILGAGKNVTHRHHTVSEWVVAMVIIFIFCNIIIWLYLLPILKNWDLPVGGCEEPFNTGMFPSACYGKSEGSLR